MTRMRFDSPAFAIASRADTIDASSMSGRANGRYWRRCALSASVCSIPGEMSLQVASPIIPARSRLSVK